MFIIGDSHVQKFKNYPKCTILNLRQPTAHNILKHEDIIITSLKKYDINLFSFGEIDCRIHFWYQHKKTENSLIYLMRITVSRYLDFIKKYNNNFNIFILAVPPTGNQENIYKYPYYAKYETRKGINLTFNSILFENCLNLKIPFINYFMESVDEQINRKEEFIADDCHLNRNIVPIIMEKINEYVKELE